MLGKRSSGCSARPLEITCRNQPGAPEARSGGSSRCSRIAASFSARVRPRKGRVPWSAS